MRALRCALGLSSSLSFSLAHPAADGLLEIQLLKRNRRGFYANGGSNADTFWFSLLQGRTGRERLQLQYPPADYYKTDWEREGVLDAQRRIGRGGSTKAIKG